MSNCKVHTLVRLHITVNGMQTHTKGAGNAVVITGCIPGDAIYCIGRHRLAGTPNGSTGHGSNRTGNNTAGTGTGAGCGRHCGRRHRCGQPFLKFHPIVLRFLIGDLVFQVSKLVFLLCHPFFVFLASGDQVRQQALGLFPLLIQFFLLSGHLLPAVPQVCLLTLQFHTGFFHLLGNFIHLLDVSAVCRSNFLNHLQAVQQVHNAIGLKQHIPIGDAAVFFYSTQTLHMLLPQLFQILVGLIQLCLLVSNQNCICRDLIIQSVDLLVQNDDLLIHILLLCNRIRHGINVFFMLRLELFQFLLQFCLLLLHLGNLILDFAGGGCIYICRYQGQQQ